MNWLFIHQSFPGQFSHIARRLAEAGHTVVSISQLPARAIPKGRALGYRPRRPAASLPALRQELERAIDNGEAVARLADQLKRTGFDPHLVIGHTGWGEMLSVKDVWPTRPLLGYFEFHHRPLVFDAEYPPTAVDVARHRANDAVDTMTLGVVDSGLTPTAFQRSTYPKPYWNRLVSPTRGSIRTGSGQSRRRASGSVIVSSFLETRLSPIALAASSRIVAFISLCEQCRRF